MNKKIAFENVVKKILGSNEEIKYQFSLGERYLKIKKIVTILMGIIILLAAGASLYYASLHFDFELNPTTVILITGLLLVLLIGIAHFYFGWYLKRANIYLITNKRIIIHRGWLSSLMKSVGFQDITDIKIIQAFLDKMIFKAGSLKINTAGKEAYEIMLHCVENPYEVKTKIIDMKYLLSEENKNK